ncbi:MAG: hypothetical protein ACE5QW_05470 [Thermoplasmata archaeon]
MKEPQAHFVRVERSQYKITAFLPKYQRIIQRLYVEASKLDAESEDERRILSAIDDLNSIETVPSSKAARKR